MLPGYPDRVPAEVSMTQPCVVVAVDFATHADEICDAAAELARDLKARVVLLHVLQLGRIPAELRIRVNDRDGTALQLVEADARTRLEPLVERVAAQDVPVELCLRAGQAHERIHACVEETGARYLVIGSDITQGLQRLLGPGFTERILQESHCPVLVVRARGSQPAQGPGPAREQVQAEADG